MTRAMRASGRGKGGAASGVDRKMLQVFEAARLCYTMDLNQFTVAEILGVSPATLTRLLQRARERGIVRFTVVPPDEYAHDVERKAARVAKALSLKKVILTPSAHRPEVVRKDLGLAAAEWIGSVLSHGMSIGFSGGRSVAEIVPFLREKVEDIDVVQLMGGVSSTEVAIQADQIARAAAAGLAGKCHVIHGPAILPSERELRQLVKNRIVADVVRRFETLSVGVVGIGTFTADNPLMQCHFLSNGEVKRLADLGCIGDICGHFFDSEGKECDDSIAGRILGIRLNQLAATVNVCAIAAGKAKIPAIQAACRARVPKVLITDVETADEILAAQ